MVGPASGFTDGTMPPFFKTYGAATTGALDAFEEAPRQECVSGREEARNASRAVEAVGPRRGSDNCTVG